MKNSFIHGVCAALVKNKVISQQEATNLEKAFKDSAQENFDNFLISENIVSRADLLKALSEYYEVPSFDAVGYTFDHDLVKEFPENFLVNHGVIPLERDENMLFMVVNDPNNEEMLPELAEYVSDEVNFFVGIHQDILDAVEAYYEDSPFHTADDEIDRRDELFEDEQLLKDVIDDKEE